MEKYRDGRRDKGMTGGREAVSRSGHITANSGPLPSTPAAAQFNSIDLCFKKS